jgi:hypothetical protein
MKEGERVSMTVFYKVEKIVRNKNNYCSLSGAPNQPNQNRDLIVFLLRKIMVNPNKRIGNAK